MVKYGSDGTALQAIEKILSEFNLKEKISLKVSDCISDRGICFNSLYFV